MSAASKSCCNRYGLLVVPAVADDVTHTLILLMNWCYTKMVSREIIIPNSMTLLCTKYYQNWSMSVEGIANQTSVISEHD